MALNKNVLPFLKKLEAVSRMALPRMNLHKYTAISGLNTRLVSCLHTSSTRREMNREKLHESKSESLTICTDVDGIRTVTLNNPKKRNALSLAMLETIKNDLTYDLKKDEVRVVIIRANGPVFSSGHDLKELTSGTGMDYHTKVFQLCAEVMNLVQDITVPVIAEVNGLATAAGCQLVATCDMAVASENAKFATPGVTNSLFCSTPGVALARSVPKKIALQMLFTGQPISAQEALLNGLVNKVVPENNLHEEVMKLAKRICEASRPVIALGKRQFYRQILLSRDGAYKEASQTMVNNLRLKEAQEGISAFIEKRQPVWTHNEDKEH